MKRNSSRAILEVERAISELRRGQCVILTQANGDALKMRSSEYSKEKPAPLAATHPAIQLMKYAGLLPQAILKPAAAEDKEQLLAVSADAIDGYTMDLSASLENIGEAAVPLPYAENARVIAFRPRFGHEEHLAVVIGSPASTPTPYVRVHSSCVTGDVFGSLRCDCGNQLRKAMEVIHRHGAGVLLYLSQEGRGIGIANKLRAYNLQDEGMDTVEANEALGFAADERDFAIAANMLKLIDIKQVVLLTNNPQKVKALAQHGIEVIKREPLATAATHHNQRYLDTKVHKLGHQLHPDK